MLVGAGANVHATDKHGGDPDEAKGHHAVVVLLQQAAELEPLTKSAAHGGAAGAD